jgi:S1-C subfamily serine protease
LGTFKPQWLDGSPFKSFGDSISTITLKESSIDPSTPNPGSHHEAVKSSMPAVVNIFISKNNSNKKSKSRALPPQHPQIPNPEDFNPNLGSGVIVSAEGLILTNEHVICCFFTSLLLRRNNEEIAHQRSGDVPYGFTTGHQKCPGSIQCHHLRHS